jgi:MYXO-CTERM domain-containing protein
MKKNQLFMLALAGALFIPAITRAQFASSVVSYNPGTGFVSGFTDPTTALGAPSQINPFGENTDPFNPPYGTNQIVSVGVGGSLTLHLNTPIQHSASNPFGVDFIIFGNTGFQITNDFDLGTFTFVGTPATDGSLFGNNTGSTRVEVSADGVNWFTLNPSLAPIVDGLFPTDGIGNPLLPVNPNLTASDFSGQTLAGIESLYGGSAGGTGFDLAWAQDGLGNGVNLAFADYVRIDVLSGTSEIDAVSVVPEPTSGALALAGAGLLWFQRRKNNRRR